MWHDSEVVLSDYPDLAEVDESVLIDAGTLRPIAVTRVSATEFIVTGTECDHQQCGVVRNGAGWACPCHGSAFELDGTVTQGPAHGDLAVYDWSLEGEVLTIFTP